MSLSGTRAIKPYNTGAVANAPSGAMTLGPSARSSPSSPSSNARPQDSWAPKTEAGHQAVKGARVLPRNSNVNTTPATNPPMCAM